MNATVMIVRHGSAGDRAAWAGADALRPLDGIGREQATAISRLLAPRAPLTVLSSPAVRCVQTVAPLAERIGAAVEQLAALAEGAVPTTADLLGAGADRPPAVLCSHGDVIGHLIGFDQPCRKGSIWLCEWDGVRLLPQTYVRKP